MKGNIRIADVILLFQKKEIITVKRMIITEYDGKVYDKQFVLKKACILHFTSSVYQHIKSGKYSCKIKDIIIDYSMDLGLTNDNIDAKLLE